jgi:hypothetical protein
MTSHFENCSAPICAEEQSGIWYIGEPVCTKDFKGREKQIKLNKKLAQGYKLDTEKPYSISTL